MPYRKTLARVVSLLAGPYGYTVTIWTAGAISLANFGAPGPWELLGFPLGAVSAFLLLAVWSRSFLAPEVPEHVSSIVVLNGVPLVAAAASLLCLLVPWRAVGFWLSSFSATLAYALGVALFLKVATPRSNS